VPPETATAISESEVIGVLTSLVDKSLAAFDETSGRYQLLETVRQYAREKLLEAADSERLRDRHMSHFLALTEEVGSLLYHTNQLGGQKRLISEYENIRAAMGWSLASPHGVDASLRYVGALAQFWVIGSFQHEAIIWTQRALATGRRASPQVLSRALESGCWAAIHADEHSLAYDLAKEWLQYARDTGDDWSIAYALFGDAIRAEHINDAAQAMANASEGMELARKTGDEWLIGRFIQVHGIAAWINNDLLKAREFIFESLSNSRKLGDDWHIGISLAILGCLERLLGDIDEARELHIEGISLVSVLNDRRILGFHLFGLAGVEVEEGNLNRAARLLGSASALIKSVGGGCPTPVQVDLELTKTKARTQLGDHGFQCAWDEGFGLTVEEAIRLALQEGSDE
jgi:hypothetical protein